MFVVGISAGLYFIEKPGRAVSPLTEMGVGGDFLLHAGAEDVRLSDFNGKVVLMFFGYTSCPDICPTTLLSLGTVLKKLNEDEASKVQVLFISVDPERDTQTLINEFTRYFHADIMGVSGSVMEIDAVVKKYASAYRKVKSDSAAGYLVDHASSIYLIDQNGDLIKLLPGDMDVDSIVSMVRGLM